MRKQDEERKVKGRRVKRTRRKVAMWSGENGKERGREGEEKREDKSGRGN